MVKELYTCIFLLIFLSIPVFAQNIIITEFMARNGTSFVDEDGDSSDWIELFNDSGSAVNLAGWTLSDDATLPALWTFPSVVIQPQAHLVVFASDKNRATAGSELHTNFKLSGGGEYLGLLRPNGTVATEFAPAYPPQESNTSYGFQTQSSGNTDLIPSFAPARAFVPTDGSLGLSWITPGFNDASWLSGTTGVGYERFSSGAYFTLIGLNLQPQMYNITPSAYVRIPFTVNNLPDLVTLDLNMKVDDGFIAYLNGTQIASRRAPTSPAWNSNSTSENPDSAALVGEDIALGVPSTFLNPGANVLAVHLLNRNVTSSDLICLPKLTAVTADYTANIVFLDTATPGAPNSLGSVGSVDDTSFTIDRGFYTAPFTTTIACPTPGATIIYTTDGSNPSLSNGTAVPAASPTQPPVAPVNISATTVLRAAAFVPGLAPSDIDTMTYIFLADVIQQDVAATLARGFPTTWDGFPPDYGLDSDVIGPNDLFTNKYAASIIGDLQSIPTISISLPLDDLFGVEGIYSHPTSRGSDWERACSVEWLDPNSTEEFQANCGLRIQGGYFRSLGAARKKSFRMLFKSQYGPSKLRFPMFDHYGLAESPYALPVEEFDTITLRMEANDGYQWGSRDDVQYARDQFLRDTGLLMGQPHGHGTRVHLYLNGVYWGVYNPIERPDASFAESYYGVDEDDWDGINRGDPINAGGDPARAARTTTAWNTLVSLSQNAANQTTPAARNVAYQTVLGNLPNGTDNPANECFLDAENYADYLIVNYWAGNSDWPHNNYYAGRENAPDSEGWRFFMWDAEWSLTMNSPVTINRINQNSGVAIPFQDLRTVEEFQVLFGDRVHRAFFNGGPLEVDATNPDANPLAPVNNQLAVRYKALTDALQSPLVAESARWGDQHRAYPRTVCNEWITERSDILTNYLPQRSGIVLQQFIAGGLYPTVTAPVYNQHGGLVPSGFPVTMSVPSGTIYYTTDGSDPRQIGGAISPTASLYTSPLVLSTTTIVKSRTWLNGQWSALNEAIFTIDTGCPLRISEVMYHARDAEGAEIPAGFDPGDYDFIEIHNPGNTPVGLVGFELTDGVTFNFANSAITTLAPGDHVLVVASALGFANRYGTGFPIAGQYTGSLDNNGEDITLAHPLLGCSVTVEYTDNRCAPIQSDGGGHSIIPTVAFTGIQLPNDPSNWRASTFRDGSPGQPDPGPPANDIRINEFATHTDLNDPAFPQNDSNDWIELYNPGASAVSLGSTWYLSDDRTNLRKWALPTASLAPGAWISFDEIAGFNSPINTGFGLSSTGEELLLSHLPGNAFDRVVDAIEFKAQDNGRTFGRLADGTSSIRGLTPTRDAANEPTAQTITINEVHYHPPAIPPGSTNDNDIAEFIELHNPLTTPVTLQSANGPWRINGETDFTFPPGTTIAPGGHLLIVRFDPATDVADLAAFNATHGLAPNAVPMVGPYSGKLANGAARLALERELDPGDWIIVDEMGYADDAPFDPAADGLGASLHRVDESVSGKLASNWIATAPPTPGAGIPAYLNLPPVFTATIPPIVIDEGMTATFTSLATDGFGQILTYALAPGAPAAATYSPATGVFSWTPGEADGPGVYTVNVIVTDNGTPAGIATQTVTITVLEVNQAPTLAPIANATTPEGQTLTVSFSATDLDFPANTLTYSLAPGAPAGMSISGGILSWTPGESDGPGTYPVTVVVTDNGAPPLSDSRLFSVTVTEVNQPPVLSPANNQTITAGQPFSLTLTAIDPDVPANILAFTLGAGAPAGLTLSPAGVLSWTPTTVGTFPVTVTVTDNGSPPLSDSTTFTITVSAAPVVNQAPVLAPVSTVVVTEGQPLALTLAATDPNAGDTLTFTLGAGAPAGMTLTPTGTLSWNPGESDGPGTYPVTVTVTDNGSPVLADSVTFFVTVAENNQSPVLAPIANTTLVEGNALSIPLSAIDPDLPANTLIYTLGAGAPPGLSITPANGLAWTPTEADGPGTYPVSVIVTDNGAPPLSVTNTFTITVTEVNQAPVLTPIANLTLPEGQPFSILPTATDVDLPVNPLTLSLAPGAPAGLTLNPTTGELTWTPTEAQGPGSYPVTLTVSDNASPALTDSTTFILTVTEQNQPPVLPATPDASITEGQTLSLSVVATDADLPANTVTHSLAPNAPTGMTISPAGSLTWTPAESDGPGTYIVQVIATDDGAPPLAATNLFRVTVVEANQPPTLGSLPAQAFPEEQSLALALAPFASDADLPANTTAFSLAPGAPPGLTLDPAGNLAWTPSETDGPGTFPVGIILTDNGLPPLATTNILTLNVTEVNRPPIINPIANPSVQVGQPLTLTATASDPDLPANTLTFSLGAGAPTGLTLTPTGVLAWTPSAVGTFPVDVIVTDNGTPPLADTVTFTVTVTAAPVGNQAPQLIPIFDPTIIENNPYNVILTATDADLPADTLTFALAPGAPTGLSLNPATGTLAWTPSEADGPGAFPVTVTVSDAGSPPLSDSISFTINVAEENQPPVLTPVANPTLPEGQLLSLPLTATDADLPANTLTIQLGPSVPAGLALDAANTLTWTPGESDGPGVFPIDIIVTDDGSPSLSVTNTLTITVTEINEPPAIAPIPDTTVAEGDVLSIPLVSSDPDVPANNSVFTLGSGAPPGMVIDTFGTLTWTPGESDGGTIVPVSVILTDDGVPPIAVTNTFNVTVTEANQAPVLAAIFDPTIAEGDPLTLTLVATDDDTPANTFTYSLAPGAPPGMTINAAGTLAWTPSESDGPGAFPVTVNVTDNGLPPLGDTISFTVNVTEENSAPAFSAVADPTLPERQPLSLALPATDSDLPANALTYSLDLGAPAGMMIDISGAVPTLTWTPTEADGPGTFSVRATVTDDASPPLSDSLNLTITVTEVNQPPVPTPVANTSVLEDEELVILLAATDPDLPANNLVFSLAPGAPAGMIINAANTLNTLNWITTPADGPANYPVSVIVTDDGSPALTATNTFIVSILEPNTESNLAPTLTPIADATTSEGQPFTVSLTATDPDGPTSGLTYTLAPGAPADMTITGNTLTWTPAESDGPGTFPVTVNVTDSGLPPLGDAHTFTLTVTEANQAPAFSAVADPTLPETQSLSLVLPATDADLPANAVTYSLAPGAPVGMVIDTSGALPTLTWTPTEADGPGTFPVRAIVTDDASPPLSDSLDLTITVTEVNQPPVPTPVANTSVIQGEALALPLAATDPDLPANNLVFTLAPGAPAGMTLNAASALNTLNWTTTSADSPGNYPVSVIVTDDGNPAQSATNAFIVSVLEPDTEPNLAPALPPVADATTPEGQPFTVSLAAIDPDGPTSGLTYTLAPGAPADMTITANTIAWTPAESDGPGTFPLTVIVTDSGVPPLSASNTFTLTVTEVNQAPALTLPGQQSLSEGQSLTLVLTATDPDLPANNLAFSLEPGAPAGMTLNLANSTLNWIPAPSATPGVYAVDITVTDNGGPALSDTATLSITLLEPDPEPNQAPVFPPLANATAPEGQPFTLTLVATDPDAPDADLTYTIASSAPPGMTIESGNILTWTPSEADGPGSFPITVTATDAGLPAESAAASFTLTIAEVNQFPVPTDPGPQVVLLGQPLTIPLAATDADLPAQSITFTLVNPPDGAAITTDSGTSLLTFIPGLEGPIDLVVRATDNASPPASTDQTITILVGPELIITGITELSAQRSRIHFPTLADQSYRLEVSPTIDDPTWTEVATLSADDATFSIDHSHNAPDTQRFYRVRLVPVGK